MTRRIIEGQYARLKGLDASLNASQQYCLSDDHFHDYDMILSKLRDEIDDPFGGFDLPNHAFESGRSANYRAIREPIHSKVRQLIAYLEAVHQASTRVVEIGSAFNLIKDEQLKSRCSDLLSASGHFDRVINQATQVLEERIRAKVPDLETVIGAALVGRAMHKEPDKSRIVFSEVVNEQEGYTALFRGMISAFRNPSHHRFMETVTREQALQLCAFIDTLLLALEVAKVVED